MNCNQPRNQLTIAFNKTRKTTVVCEKFELFVVFCFVANLTTRREANTCKQQLPTYSLPSSVPSAEVYLYPL